MPPRLAAISGKLKGAIFAINEEALVIGRETAANLCIADASVSRRHSKIEKKEDGFVITDLESLNGTFVNDVPVRSRLLEHGDRVRIGDSQFLFLTHEGDATVEVERRQARRSARNQRLDGADPFRRRDLPDGARPERADEGQHHDQLDPWSRRSARTSARTALRSCARRAWRDSAD